MNQNIFNAAGIFSFVLSVSAVSFAADINTVPQKTGKDFYRTYPKGGFVMPEKSVSPQFEYNAGRQPLTIAPQLNGTILSPDNSFGNRQIPVPPSVPNRTEQSEFISDIILPGETVVLPPSGTDEIIVSDRKIDEVPAAQNSSQRSYDRPLSGIYLPERTAIPQPSNGKLWSSSVAAESEKPEYRSPTPAPSLPLPVSESSVNMKSEAANTAANTVLEKSRLDEFNGRLAKIQLEKKNLTEVLVLIDKIKSPEFKVKTLVDLAEYVSRDSNYKSEAETLYGLAVAGIDALTLGKPVVVKAPDTAAKPVSAPKAESPYLTLPKTTVEIKEVPKLEPKPEIKPSVRKPLTLVDEAEETLPKPAAAPAEKKSEEKPLDIKPSETKPAEFKKIPEVKPEGTKPLENSGSKNKITLIDEAEETLPKPAAAPAEKKSEEKPLGIKPAETAPSETKPAEVVKPAETKQPEPETTAPVKKPLKRNIIKLD